MPDPKYSQADNAARWGLGQHNLCRVADWDAPWCYVDDPHRIWDYCLPVCDHDACLRQRNGSAACFETQRSECAGYMGELDVTLSGHKCASWSVASLTGRGGWSEYVEEGRRRSWGLDDKSVCRQAGWHVPWCVLEDRNADKNWEECALPCPD